MPGLMGRGNVFMQLAASGAIDPELCPGTGTWQSTVAKEFDQQNLTKCMDVLCNDSFVGTQKKDVLIARKLSYKAWLQKALLDYDVGGAAAGGIIAVIFANIVAFFLLSFLSKNIN